MRPATCFPTGESHYQVVSPTMTEYHYMEPPDPFVCFGVCLARTQRQARVLAVKDPEFAEWVNEQRANREPPFKGLKIELTRCDHGVCWECHATDESSGCAECDAKTEAEMAAVGW